MSSAYFGISVLKKNLPEKQLGIFLSSTDTIKRIFIDGRDL